MRAELHEVSSWTSAPLEEGATLGSALVVDDSGRLTSLAPVRESGELRFLTCVASCLEAGNWQMAVVDRPDIFEGSLNGPPRLALSPQGRLRMIYSSSQRAFELP